MEIKLGQVWALSNGNIYKIVATWPNKRKLTVRLLGYVYKHGLAVCVSRRYGDNESVVNASWLRKKMDAGKALRLSKRKL